MASNNWRADGDEDDMNIPLVDAMEDHMASYDESLYYACKDYVSLHMLYHKQKKRTEDVVDVPLRYKILLLWTRPFATRWGRTYFFIMCSLVMLSLTQLVFESIPAYSADIFPWRQKLWDALEIPTAICFLIDILVHVAVLPPVPNDFSRWSRRSYVKKLEFWVDLISILPSATPYIARAITGFPPLDFLKALRVLRFTKVLRQFHAVDQLAHTVEQSAQPLFGPLVFLFGILVTMSGALYYAERGDYDEEKKMYLIDDCDCLMSAPKILNPEYNCGKVPSKFVSLPAALWFCLVTVTTVGYGSEVPLCTPGRIFAIITILCGNVLTAMPIAIVGTYFTSNVVTNRKRQASDTSTAFGRKARSQPNIFLENAADGAGENDKHDDDDGSGAADHSTVETMGERLFEALKSLKYGPISLLAPPGVVLHVINSFMYHEFDMLISLLTTKRCIQEVKEHRNLAMSKLALEHVSSPTICSFPKQVPLTRPLCLVFGSAPGGLLYCLPLRGSKMLPTILCLFHVCPVRSWVTVTALFPATVRINGTLLAYDRPARLLVGDHVQIMGDAADEERPVLCYQYLKVEPPGMAALPPSMKQQQNQVVIQKAQQQQQRMHGEGSTFRLRAVEPMPEFRNLTFSSYAQTFRARDTREFQDL